MKKIFNTLLVVLLLVLTACHSSNQTAQFEVPSEFDETKEYNIVFWAKNDSNIKQVNAYNKAVEEFEKIYPNIHVEIKRYTDYQVIYNDVITNIATKTTPNICITYPDHIATYMTGENVVVPLDELMTDEKYGFGGSDIKFDAPKIDEIVPYYLEECKLNGTYYGLPYMRSTEACYVNVDLLNKLGYELPETLTWDFVFEVCHAAMEKDENGYYKCNGQKTLIPLIYKSSDNMMIQMLKQAGYDYSNDDGDILIFNEDTKSILKMIAPYAKEKSFSTFKISSYPGNFLNAGQCIFAIDSTAGSTWMGSEADLQDIDDSNIVKFKCEVKMIPQFDVDNPYIISQGPSLCIFNKEDQGEVMASWIFCQYLLSNNVQLSYAQTEGYVPVTYKAQNSEEYIDYLSREGEDNSLYYDIKIKSSKLLLNNLDHTFITPIFNGSTSLRSAASSLVEEVTKSARRNQEIDDAYLDELFENTKALYRLDQTSSLDGKVSFDELPKTSIILISSIGAAWVLIGIYYISLKIKEKKK